MLFFDHSETIHLAKPTAVVIGKFDGVHLGHKALFDRALAIAGEKNLLAAAFTFDRNLSGNKVLTTSEERKQLVMQYGMDVLIEYPFAEIMSLSPEEFVRDILVDQLNAKAVVAGCDCGFGRNRAGNAQVLKEFGKKYGFDVFILDKVQLDHQVVSSTFIRSLIEKGDVEKAGKFLGGAFLIKGVVVLGNQLGRTWNFPTINILPDEAKMMPLNGVYASKVFLDGIWRGSVTNIGRKPTVDSRNGIVSAETYIFDYSGDLYGRTLDVLLYHFIREEKRFTSFTELKEQIVRDCEAAGKILLSL